MPGPLVFISRNRVKAGMLDEFREHYLESVPLTQSSKAGTLVQLAYTSEGAAEVTILRLFPDAEALDWQLQGADQRSKAAYQFIEPTGIEIFGEPGEFALQMMKRVAGSGTDVRSTRDLWGLHAARLDVDPGIDHKVLNIAKPSRPTSHQGSLINPRRSVSSASSACSHPGEHHLVAISIPGWAEGLREFLLLRRRVHP